MAWRSPFYRVLVTLFAGLGLMLASSFVQAQEHTEAEKAAEARDSVQESVQEEASQQVEEKQQELIAEAVAAVEATHEAISALEEEDAKSALEALALATGKLELAIARNPELALAPVDVEVIRHDLIGDLENIRVTREKIEELIEDDKLQEARGLLKNFGSELVFRTRHLPLATYPDAIKLATRLIDEGDLEDARQLLLSTLTTLVETREAIPLPILRAELLLEAAEAALAGIDESGEGEEMTPEEFVEAAQRQLKLAQAFGYGEKKDFRDLRENVEDLREKVAANKKTGGLFDKIAENFTELKQRLGLEED